MLLVGLVLMTGCANGVDTGAGASIDAGAPIASDAGDAGPGRDARAPDSSTDAPVPPADAGGSEGFPETSVVVHDASIVDASFDATPSLPLALGAWSFDEGTGTSSADLSGHGHPATLVGGASWAPAGKQGAGLALDGATGYADVGVRLVDTTASFTTLAWVRFTVAGSWQVALSEDDVTGSLFGLKLRGDGSNQFDFDAERTDTTNPAFVVAQSTSTAQAGSWVHLAGVYDASGTGVLKVYVDGVPQANAAVGQPLLSATGHFLIGRGLYNGAAGSYLDGTIDEVAVYDVALTDAQISAVYAAQQ
jgi:hypothetical protein